MFGFWSLFSAFSNRERGVGHYFFSSVINNFSTSPGPPSQSRLPGSHQAQSPNTREQSFTLTHSILGLMDFPLICFSPGIKLRSLLVHLLLKISLSILAIAFIHYSRARTLAVSSGWQLHLFPHSMLHFHGVISVSHHYLAYPPLNRHSHTIKHFLKIIHPIFF